MSIRKLAGLLAVIAATAIGAATAHATSARTWVSNAGSDSNPCSVTQPCLTFAGALANTSSGGEINCLNAGGFGTVTINKPVTIDCEAVSNGGIAVSSGNAITVTATGAVTLIGLDIDGQGSATFGVNITASAIVNIRNCKVYGFSGTGIILQPSSSVGTLVVDNAFVTNNGNGIYEGGSSGATNMTLRNSNISHNSTGIAVDGSEGAHTGITIEQTTLAFNAIGLSVGESDAIALLGGSTVVNNDYGVTNNGATVYSFKDNQIGGNGTDGTPLTAYPGGPLN
jgi:Right handed beta helix region